MKYLKFIILSLLILSLQGCSLNNPKYINLTSKPNDYYYSSKIYKNLKLNEPFTLKLFDSTFYKYYTVDEEDSSIIIDFLESLNNDNYVSELDIKDSPTFELSIEFQKEKYIINIYDDNSITLYPWDGTYPEDKITMTNVSSYNNLYYFCTYVINKAHARENNL